MSLYFVKNKIMLIIALILLIITLSACQTIGYKTEEPVTKTKFALDTICSITIYDPSDDEIFDECFNRIAEIEKKMSVNLKESEVTAINKNAGSKAVKVSEDTYKVICTGKKYSEMMRGKFDITVGPLVKLWGINTPDEKIPSENNIKSTLPHINYQNIIIKDEDRSIFLKEKGMSLDLGGIAKGYSGDAVAEILRKNNVKHAIVDLGGNLVVLGAKPDGTDWKVGIQTPFKPQGDYFGILDTSNKAVVTSGIYQRYFEKNGKIYHHIMDTSTGYPVNNGLLSVTIVCANSIDADALAKVFTLGLDKGMQFIENQKAVEAIFVTDKFEVHITPGLKNLFKITNNEYKLIE